MKKYIDLKSSNDYSDLQEAGQIIRSGGLILFPTETVYGLGANGLDEVAVKKIFEAKGRSSDNPLILHISDKEMLNDIATDISEIEHKLMDAFWPGPFTIILNRKPVVPNIVTASLDTVGIRMPDSLIARTLIDYSGVPIATPSANISGKPSGTSVDNIMKDFKDSVDCIIDSGESKLGIASTIVKVENEKPIILREGSIKKDEIFDFVNNYSKRKN